MRKLALICVTCFFVQVILGAILEAREKGWVPLENNNAASLKLPKEAFPRTQTAKNVQKSKLDSKKSGKHLQKGATIYANQPPISEKELGPFMELLPRFRIWASKNGEEAHPVVSPNGEPDFIYSQKAAKWVSSQNFDPIRFFCIMGRLAAGLVIVEEGNDYKGTRPADMPPVAPQELNLVRKHLGELLAVSGPVKPIRMQ